MSLSYMNISFYISDIFQIKNFLSVEKINFESKYFMLWLKKINKNQGKNKYINIAFIFYY